MSVLSLFNHTIPKGKLEDLQWIAERFNLTTEDIRNDTSFALKLACDNGRTDVATWLIERFNLTEEDARDDNNYVLRFS